MAYLQVSCINKPFPFDTNSRIRGIGGMQGFQRWYLSEQEAIAAILTNQHQFYVAVMGRTVKVIVAYRGPTDPYLKTEADGFRPDNLLSLPQCP